MWKYASILMTAGIFVARPGKRRTVFLRYQKPQVRDKFWKTKSMRAIRDSLAHKIGTRCHTSVGFTRGHMFPFFRLTMKNTSYATYIAASLELSREEIAFILDEAPEAERIQKIYERAQSVIREGECEISIDICEEKIEEKTKEVSKWGSAQKTIDDAWG